MKKCPECATENDAQSGYCGFCGFQLQTITTNLICPACKKSYTADTAFCIADGSRLVLPGDIPVQTSAYQEGVFDGLLQQYPKASLENRFLASLLDTLIVVGLSLPAIAVFLVAVNKSRSYRSEGALGILFMSILLYFIPLIYSFIKDGLGSGQSWGKQAMRLMVVDLDNHRPCSKGKSLVRNLISGLISIIPFVGWLVEPLMVLSTSDGRKLGDKAANTMVIDRYYFG